METTLASIHVYPIKSLGGFSAAEAPLTDRGLQHDRRWMLVDGQGRFLSQREVAGMARLHCAPAADGFRVTDLRDGAAIDLPWTIATHRKERVNIWDDALDALHGEARWDLWFSDRLEREVRLVHMPDASQRPTDPTYARAFTSLSDGFPYLAISQASLDELNARMSSPIPMDRFRPNLVIAGGSAFQEDAWRDVMIGSARFQFVKPCARCVITTTDQRTGARGKEPLRTLATFRSAGQKVMFGMNVVGDVSGKIRAGDAVRPL
ncbi:MAG: MOSC domain-containing protein [Flavobacteriales bacterium]|nr:MOSC domain-containing protein [Flavobacteriales bacterium]